MTRQDTLMTVTEVAAELSVHPATVRRWIAAGSLAAVKLPGGVYRVAPGAVQDMLRRAA